MLKKTYLFKPTRQCMIFHISFWWTAFVETRELARVKSKTHIIESNQKRASLSYSSLTCPRLSPLTALAWAPVGPKGYLGSPAFNNQSFIKKFNAGCVKDAHLFRFQVP